ncbi:Tat-linked quality control protein TatD [uncultured archaeon]|nr:Tat-linked quality control protein TatD [uncultured archaeon]
MRLIDVHCHLEGERFAKDLDEVLQNAHKVGVKAAFCSGVNPETNRKVMNLAKEHSLIKACFGLYPLDAIVSKFPEIQDDDFRKIESFDYKEELNWIDKNFHLCVAIGEVGLDFKMIKDLKNFEEVKEEQKKVFEEVLVLAKKLDKPVIVHTRGAELECIEILEKHKMSKVVLHCFGGKKSLIKRAADNGWFFSVPAVITRLQHFQTLVDIVPIEQLLTETDAPYLAPVAGERSEPKDVAVTVKEIAKIKNMEVEEVADQIWKNAEGLFGKI